MCWKRAGILLLLAGTVPAEDDLLPPVQPWKGRSLDLLAERGNRWATPFEKSGLEATPRYDETVAWLKRLVAAAPQLAMVSLGRSDEGRDVWMVVASKEGASTAAGLRGNGKPTLLAVAGIHSGEIDGKDAGMMLLRDVTVGGSKKALLERANLLFVPIHSVDAHERFGPDNRVNQRGPVEMGWRTNSRNLNLNRDFAKLDTLELRALLRAIHDWAPTLYYDIHVTDGADYQYDITWGYNGPHAYSPAIARWLGANLDPALERDLAAMGHIPGPLVFAVDPRDMTKGNSEPTMGPRFSNGYGDLRHLPTLLVENHSLKPYVQRVLGTYVLLESTLRVLGEKGDGLVEATEKDRARRRAEVPLTWKRQPGDPPTMRFLGIGQRVEPAPITGGDRIVWTGEPITIEIAVVRRNVPDITVARPKAYWVPPSWPEVIRRLLLHGIEMERIAEPREVDLEMYRVKRYELAKRPFEGHVRVSAEVSVEEGKMRFPAGSVRIPTDQPLGDLAILLLEPRSPDSFFQWGFFLEILQRAEYVENYVMVPLAERMLNEDPELKRAYEKKVGSDAEFAGDPEARLRWFYERTPHFDARYRLYPVGRQKG